MARKDRLTNDATVALTALVVIQGLAIATFALSLRTLGKRMSSVETRFERDLVGLAQQVRKKSARIGLPKGAQVPSFALSGRNGAVVDNRSFVGKRTLVLFARDACPLCDRLLAEVASEGRAATTQPWDSTLVIAKGDSDTLSASVPENLGLAFDPDGTTHQAFNVEHPPAVAVVDPGGRILISGAAKHHKDILTLIGNR